MSIKSILQEFDQDIGHDLWYLIAAVVMSSVNQPEDIRHVYDIISTQINNGGNQTEQEKNELLTNIVLKLREALLKSYIIIGFPKTVNTLYQLFNVTPDSIKCLLPNKPLRKEDTWSDIQLERQRGNSLFNKIYDSYADKVLKKMYNSHPDLAQTALNQLYGPTLGENTILSARETSLITVTALMIQNVQLQLISHRHGAIHNGASRHDIDCVRSIVSAMATYYKTPIAKL